VACRESVEATESANAQRVAVRSIAWLDLPCVRMCAPEPDRSDYAENNKPNGHLREQH